MNPSHQYNGFEQGPIRPPSEAESLLIRMSRNCPWNRCTFCSLYKDSSFSMRPAEHVIRDIDTIKNYTEKIEKGLKSGSPLSSQELLDSPGNNVESELNALYAARLFVNGGKKSVFLQDGDSLSRKSEEVIHILRHLKNAFPELQRITSYARSKTIARISEEDLNRMAEAGLNRIHIGLESGDDEVLEKVKKGVDKETQIAAGQKVKKAGIELSLYYIPGLGGRALSEKNALETADAVNRINPDFIRIRTLGLSPGAPITEEKQKGAFDKMGEVETAEELLLFLEALEGIDSTVKSDHVVNLFMEMNGVLPEDKENLIFPVKKYLSLPPGEQRLFSIGRRTHQLRRIDDLENPALRAAAQRIQDELNVTTENFDDIIDTIMQRFI